jgi:hypothetical protein
MGLSGQHHAPAALPPRKNSVLIVQEAGWAQMQAWTCTENLAPDRSARSELLYLLRRRRHRLGQLGLSKIRAKLQLYIYCGVHKFSRILGATSKLKLS